MDTGEQNLIGKLFLKLNGIYGRAGCSWIFPRFIRDRQAFRGAIEELLRWDYRPVGAGSRRGHRARRRESTRGSVCRRVDEPLRKKPAGENDIVGA